MNTIKTEAEYEDLLSDPEAMRAHIRAQMEAVAEKAKEPDMAEVARAVAETAIKEAVEKHGGQPQRLPMSEAPNTPATDLMLGNPSAEANGRAQSLALNGKFRSFGEFLTSIIPSVQMQRGGMDERLVKVLAGSSGDQGGFLVPEQFVSDIMTLALEMSIVRPRALVMPMASDTMRIPAVRDTTHASTVFGGVQSLWTPESGTITANEPTFSQLMFTAHKLVNSTIVSNELLADSAIGLQALLTRMFAEANAYFQDDAFLNGTGVGQPTGILNSSGLVSVAKESGQSATTIVAENLDKMYSRMLGPSKARAVWVAHTNTFPQLAAMSRSVGSGGSAVFVANMVGAPPVTIYGRPVIFSEKCQTLGTVGDIYFADFSQYIIADRQSMTMAASEHVRFGTDEIQFRGISRLDGKPWLETPLTPRNGSSTLGHFVALATRS